MKENQKSKIKNQKLSLSDPCPAWVRGTHAQAWVWRGKRDGVYFVVSLSIIAISIICAGCVDIEIGEMGLIDTVSVNEKGEVALCLDDDVYITDFNGGNFKRVTENEYYNSSVSWFNEGLLYTEKQDDVWTLNLYKPDGESTLLLQEIDKIALPVYNSELSYIVLPKEEEMFGNINIYEMGTSRIYTLIENAYYDYEWLPGQKKIVAICASNVNENTFNGFLLIKDMDNLSEEIIFNGSFKINWDYVDITRDNKIIFSSEGEIYLYDIDTKELSKWEGPKEYDYRLPPSVNSSLKGYVLAKIKSIEEDWAGQLYLVKPDGKIISIPGWPIWIDEPMVLCIDLDSYDIIAMNLEKNEIIDLTKKFCESKEGTG